MVGACSLNLAVLERGLAVLRRGYTPAWSNRGHCGAESSVLEGRLIAVEAKKVTLEDRDGEDQGRHDDTKKERHRFPSSPSAEAAKALEKAGQSLQACVEDFDPDPGQAELLRGARDVVVATQKLVVCLQKTRAVVAE